MDVETSIEPPVFEAEDDDRPSVFVAANLIENDGTYRNANATVPGEATNEQLADALIACVRGAAAMRGPGLVAAVERRLR